MTEKHLSNDEFLTRLTTLLRTTHTKNHGSIFLNQKPVSLSSPLATSASQRQQQQQPEKQESQPTQILIRATNGKSKAHREKTTAGKGEGTGGKEKLSTIVNIESDGSGAGLEDFYRRYAEVCKKGMEGLRKRDRKKGRKKKDKGKKGATGVGAG